MKKLDRHSATLRVAAHPGEAGACDHDTDELALHGGRSLHVEHDVVEIRAASGQVELRIRLTDEGPVLQMDAARLELRASESIEIASKRIELKAEGDIKADAKGEVRLNGAMIWLN